MSTEYIFGIFKLLAQYKRTKKSFDLVSKLTKIKVHFEKIMTTNMKKIQQIL